MPKPKGKRAGTKGRWAAPAKAVVKARKPKARRAAKPVARKGHAPAAKKKIAARTPAKPAPRKKVATKAPAKPAPLVAKPAAPPAAAPAAKAAPPVTKAEKKEATSMADQATKCPIHGVPDCFKPALDAYIAQAYDGYCTKIDWPFVRIIPKGWKPGT